MDTRQLLYSRLDALARRNQNLDARERKEAEQLFTQTLSKTIDTPILEEIFDYWNQDARDTASLSKLGDLGALLLDPESEPDNPLTPGDYSALSEIVSSHAEEMDIDQLTNMMNLFLSKGAL